ncbi:MAG TPA: protein kinase [Planctomycetota bacterium]|nr:protein kinase [Planctomycetota bacterium]
MAELQLTCPKCQKANTVALGAEVEQYTCSSCGSENSLVETGPVEAAVDPLIGAVISECKIMEKLGEGGFGAVYKAFDQNLQRPVALKVMLQSLTSNQEFVQKFIREAITAAQLNHPNIVAIHKVGRDEKRGIHYLIMELLDGKTLENVVHDRGVLKPEEAVPFMLQASEALAAAHDKKIVHRDIKPENIMVDKRGVVKIMDFGLAKVVQPDMKSTKVMGTPHYMSPEQFEGKQVDGRTDIYSLGVTFYYILSRARPYEGTNTVQIIYSILTSEPRSLLDANPTAPGELWTIVQKMIAKKPEDRYLDFRAVRKDLLAYQEKSLADRVTCPQCGAKNSRGKKFCRQCGGNLSVKCPACGAEEVAGAVACSACGVAIEALLAVKQNMERAQKLKSVGDLKRAFLLLKEVLKVDPKHAEAQKECDEIDGALKEVETVKTAALELEKTGNLEDALGKVEALLGRYPGSEDIKRHRDGIKRAFDGRIIAQHMRRADESIAAGNLNAALVALDAALRLDPKREDILARRRDLEDKVKAAEAARTEAAEAFKSKRYAEAFRRATEVLRGNPGDADMAQILEQCRGFLESSEEFVRRGREHLEAGRLVEAKQELEAASNLRENDPDVQELIVEVENRLNTFRDLLVEARTALGDAKFDLAREKVGAVLVSLPGDPEALGLMATIARQEAEAAKAGAVNSAIEEGEALEKKGALEEALNAFRRAVDADPDSTRASQARDRVEAKLREISSIRALADEHLRDGRFEEALHALEKLKGLLPGDKEVASETDEARVKVDHIRGALRKAEKAAAEKDHRAAAAAAKEILDLSPNHIRAQSLKRDAERAANAIDRHLKEAERLVASQIFEDALEQLKKAKQKGGSADQVGPLEKTAVDGITAALKTEATRFYAARDYSAALDAYERILELRATDTVAKQGRLEAERRLRSLTSEPITMRSAVAGAAAAVLLMFQIAAVRFATTPPLERKTDITDTGGTKVEIRPLEIADLRGLEAAKEWAKARARWASQDGSSAENDERMQAADTVLAALEAAAAPGDDPVAAILALQQVDKALDTEQDQELQKGRIAAAQAALDGLIDGVIARIEALEKEKKTDQAQALAEAVTVNTALADSGLNYLSAKRLQNSVNLKRGSLSAKAIVSGALTDARSKGTLAGWLTVDRRIKVETEALRADASPEVVSKLEKEFNDEYRTAWREDLKSRFAKNPQRADFVTAVEEAGAFLEKFGLLGNEAEENALLGELKTR